MNAALIRGRRSLIFLLSYAALNRVNTAVETMENVSNGRKTSLRKSSDVFITQRSQSFFASKV